MADYKKEGGTSFVGGALGVGAFAYGAHKSWESWTNRANNGPILSAYDSTSEMAKTNAALQNFASKYEMPKTTGRQSRFERALGKVEQNLFLSTDQIKMLTRMASGRADPTGELWRDLEQQLGSAATPKQAIEHLRRMAATRNNIYLERTIEQLMPNLVKLNRAASKGISVNPLSIMESGFRPFDLSKGGGSLVEKGMLPKGFEEEIGRLEKSLGVNISATYRSRADRPGASVTLWAPRSKTTPAFELRIPMEISKGIVVQGETQQTKYIAGRFAFVTQAEAVQGSKVISTMSYDQFMVNRAIAELVPELQSLHKDDVWGARRVVGGFQSRMREYLDYVGPLEPWQHEGLQKQLSARADILRLFELKGQRAVPLDIWEQSKMLATGGVNLAEGGFQPLFPGFSATQAGKGVLSTRDIRNEIYLIPELAPYERKPAGIIREKFAPSAAAKGAMEQSSLTQKFRWAAAKAGVDAPFGRTLFISAAHANKLVNTGISTEGQGLASKRMIEQLGQTMWETTDIALGGSEGKPGPSQALKDLLPGEGPSWLIDKKLEQEMLLGYDPTGQAKFLPSGSHVLEATVFADKNKGNFLRVTSFRDIEKMRTAKFFGHKEMAMFTSDKYIKRLTEQLGLEHTGRVDYMMTMDELKKNRSLHYNQMFTGLYDFIRQNSDRNLHMGELATNYATNPMGIISDIRSKALTGGEWRHEIAMGEILKVARSGNLHSWKIGQIFGALPEIEGDKWQSMFQTGDLTKAEIEAIQKGQARGVTQLFFGGLGKSQGAGGVGSIEPRLFELLSGSQYGELGPIIQQEILGRQLASQPGRMFEYRELMTSLGSIVDPRTRTGGLSAKEILSMKAEGLKSVSAGKGLPSAATNLRIAGFGDVYIPGASTLSQLAGYKTANSSMVYTPVTGAYRDVLDAASQFEEGQIPKEVLQGNVTNLRNEITRAITATATGKGGILRSGVPGSLYLRAMSPHAKMALPENTAGIAKADFQRMFKNLMDMYGENDAYKQQLEAIQEQFMAGKPVGGVAWRHPAIGQFSTLPMNIQKVKAPAGHVFIPETLYTGEIKTLAGEAMTLTEANPIRLSPFVGMAGDVDGDIMSLMLSGPQLNDKTMAYANDKAFQSAYRDHSIMIQLLKAKAKGSTTIQQLIADAQVKLSTTQGGVLGQVSTKLQAYRAAMSMDIAGIGKQVGGAERIARGMTLLEWLEQMPISGKHIAPGEAIKTVQQMTNLTAMLGQGDIQEITSAAESFLKLGTPQAQAALREGVSYDLAPIGGGERISGQLRGINVQEAVADFVSARDALMNMEVGDVSAARMRSLAMGKIKPEVMDIADVKAIMSTEATQMSNLLATAPGITREGGMMANVSRRVLGVTNQLGAAGKKLLPHAKPLLMGSAVGLGIAAVLSSPPKLLPTGSTAPPPADQINLESGKATDRMGTNIHPEGTMRARPTVSNPIPRTARVAPPPQGYRIRADAYADKNADYRAMGRQLAGGVRGSSHSTVSDRRDTLTPQKLASILRGE